jgi:GR25 family glycosyltransferase involved in LPS biosynthesis
MKIKPVIISLPFEVEKRYFMKETLQKCNFSDYIIIDGVNGNDIKIIPFVQEPHMSKLIYNNTEKIYNSRLRLNGLGLQKGEMGCAWSHLNVYDILLKDNENDAYLIFEDDADLIVSPEELQTFLEELKTLSFDLCHIFQSEWYDFNKITQISNNFWIPERRFFNNTGAYIITKTGAKKLLDFSQPEIGLPSDDLISNFYINSNDFNFIVPCKHLFKPKGFESSIQKINNLPDKPQKLISIKDFGIWARLGNQMFQYAYLRALSIEKGFKINLPIYPSGHQYKTSQFFDSFEMDIVDTTDIVEDFVTISETSMMYQDKFASENIDTNQNIMFAGYFQCEKYFEKYKDIIRSDFTFKENIRNVGDIFMSQFDNNRKRVALHVRRADNLSDGSPTLVIKEIFRVNAINYLLKNNVTDFDLLIFSDDKQWCKDNLNYTSDNICQTIIEGLSDLEELYVMSLCDHFIIGSSSYSWWAAWLSKNKDKIVIVPEKWFKNILYNGTPLCDQEKDLCPKSWIRLQENSVF